MQTCCSCKNLTLFDKMAETDRKKQLSCAKDHSAVRPIPSQHGNMVDPLTGKKIEFSRLNGLSYYKKTTGNIEKKGLPVSHVVSEGNSSWSFQSKWSHDSSLNGKKSLDELGQRYNTDRKWRLQGSAKLKEKIKEENEDEERLLSSIFKTWRNPVFGVSKEKQLEAQVDMCLPCKPNGRKLASNGFTFRKEHFENIQVIGQVDKKFIACYSSATNKSAEEAKLLVVIDQHAAHERIRLEQLQDEFLQGMITTAKGPLLDYKELFPPLNLALSLSFGSSMRQFKDSFNSIGIRYIVKREVFSEDKNCIDIAVTTLPAFFVKTSNNHGRLINKPILEDSSIKELFYEHMKRNQETPVTASVLPPAVNNVLCSYACHSAIRFGDPLTLVECNQIIQSLAKCRLPFQCAHGRPSIAPLIQLRPPSQL